MAHHSFAEYMRDAWEPGWLDTSKIHLHPSKAWGLCLTLGDERSWLGISVVRAFPLSQSNEYLVFLNHKQDEIGTIRSLSGMKPPVRKLVEKALSCRYFVNMVEQVHSVRSESDTLYFTVASQRGQRELVVRANRETVVRLQNGHILLVDVDGNRFELPAVERLDQRSQVVLQQVM